MGYLANLPTFPFIVVAALLSGLFLFVNSRKNSYRDASLLFRSALEPTITELRNGNESTVSVLESSFAKHEEAVREFSKHLIWSRKEFDKCWRDYAFHPEAGLRFLEAYTSVGVSVSKAKENRQLAIQKLQNLISYTKP